MPYEPERADFAYLPDPGATSASPTDGLARAG